MKQITYFLLSTIFTLILFLCSCKKDNQYLIGEWKDLTTDSHHYLKILDDGIVIFTDNDAYSDEGKYIVKGDSLFINIQSVRYQLYIDKENKELKGVGEEPFDDHLYKFTAIFKKKTETFQDSDMSMIKGLQCLIQDKDGYTNVRSKPDVSSDILYKIYDNETFYVDPILDGNWYCVVEYKNKPVGWVHKSRVKVISSNTHGSSPNTANDNYDRNQKKLVTINSEMDFRAYINNKTFQSFSDNITFKYKNSENTVYIGNTAAGTLQIVNYSQTVDGTIVTFLVRSPYRNNPIRYSFATPDILFDEEGREYRMR